MRGRFLSQVPARQFSQHHHDCFLGAQHPVGASAPVMTIVIQAETQGEMGD